MLGPTEQLAAAEISQFLLYGFFESSGSGVFEKRLDRLFDLDPNLPGCWLRFFDLGRINRRRGDMR